MDTSQGWVSRASTFSAGLHVALLIALVSGCRNHPINPFLAHENPTFKEDFENPNSELEDPLADSLTRLKQRGEEFRDAAATATDAAQGLHDDAQAVAHDALSETRQALATSLQTAEHEGRQLANDTVAAANATVREASTNAQRRAVESLEELPLEQAGPILLITMAQGPPAAQQAAAEQLARRWPPAAGYSGEGAAERRAEAAAALRARWIEQYGQIDEAVAVARAEAARTIDDAGQLLGDATGVVQAANQQMSDVQGTVNAYHEANPPDATSQ